MQDPQRRRTHSSRGIRSIVLAVILTPAAQALPACQSMLPGEACTEMGCSDGLTVTFQHSPWEAGHYRFEISVDGTSNTSSCEADLPLPKNPGKTCTDPRLLLGLSGSELPPKDQSISELVFSDGWHPKLLHITALKDGVELAASGFSPTYTKVAPNGEDCGPVCDQASVTFKF